VSLGLFGWNGPPHLEQQELVGIRPAIEMLVMRREFCSVRGKVEDCQSFEIGCGIKKGFLVESRPKPSTDE